MFELPKLQYNYNALEPFIDEETMTIHHAKHHQAYIDNLNKIVEKIPEAKGKTIEEILSHVDDFPKELRQSLINHGGGHYNHSFFWKIMSPAKTKPSKEFESAVSAAFSSFEDFKGEFIEKAMGVFGSGWAFLVVTPSKELLIKRHSFQNPPIMNGNIPVLGVDVWEHAYYLKYQNRRAEYLENWWNVINWDQVSENFSNS